MTNFTDLSDTEIDKLAAEMMGMHYYVWCGSESSGKCKVCGFYSTQNSEHIDKNWNPTHPDLNQAERYLFPKLRPLEITCTFGKAEGISIDVWKDGVTFLEDIQCDKDDKINRTKVIACLEALEKINE